MKVDLPALGRPTSPASASSFSRSHTHISSPGQPGPCWRGARLVEVLKLALPRPPSRSEEHTSELQSLMRISYAVFCLKKKKININRLKTTRNMNTHNAVLYNYDTSNNIYK